MKGGRFLIGLSFFERIGKGKKPVLFCDGILNQDRLGTNTEEKADQRRNFFFLQVPAGASIDAVWQSLCSVVDPFTFAAVVAELPAAAPEPEADEEGNVPEQEAHCARNACWPAGLLACWLLAAGCWLLAAAATATQL